MKKTVEETCTPFFTENHKIKVEQNKLNKLTHEPNYGYTPDLLMQNMLIMVKKALQVSLYTQCVVYIFVTFCHDTFFRNVYYTTQKQHTGMLEVVPAFLLLPTKL